MSNDAIRALIDVTRADWGAAPPPRAHAHVDHTHIEVHHDVFSAGLAAEGHCREIDKLHRGWGWNGAFYNLGLARDGRLYDLRGVGHKSQGAALTVVLFGDYEHDVAMTPPQIQALSKLRGILPKPLDWHQQRYLRTGVGSASACPGRNVIPMLPTIEPSAGSSAPTTTPPGRYHTVVAGETLWAVSRLYSTSWEELARLNGIPEPYTIYPGQLLRVA